MHDRSPVPLTQLRALCIRKKYGRSTLHHFLVASLHCAIAFKQVHQPAVAIPKYLHLDVPRAPDELLEVHLVVAKAAFASRRATGNSSASCSSLSTTRMPRPPPPQLAFSITGYPMPRASCAHSVIFVGSGGVAGIIGTPADVARFRAATLLPRVRMVSGVGPTKTMPAAAARLGEFRILGQESVARMNGVDASLPRYAQDVIDRQIGFDRTFIPPNEVRFVRFRPMQRKAILLRIDRNGTHARARWPPA